MRKLNNCVIKLQGLESEEQINWKRVLVLWLNPKRFYGVTVINLLCLQSWKLIKANRFININC